MKRSDQRRAAVVALYQRDVTGRPLESLLPRDTKEFTRELALGADAEQAELDALIERHSVGWTLDRIAPLERNILRVALYELLWCDSVPDAVAIDEAVELAKSLSTDASPAFVNGLLSKVVRDGVRAHREHVGVHAVRRLDERRHSIHGGVDQRAIGSGLLHRFGQ